MARGPKKQAKPGIHKSIYKEPDSSAVRRIKGAAMMATLGPEHPVWTRADLPFNESCNGHFFRLIPPEETLQAMVDVLATKLRADGAAGVKVLPTPSAKAVPESAYEAPAAADLREVVMALMAESKAVDPAALLEVVEAALAAAGL